MAAAAVDPARAEVGAGSLWNQGSWHWEERNHSRWAHEWIKTALCDVRGLTVAGGWSVSVGVGAEVKGDVSRGVLRG